MTLGRTLAVFFTLRFTRTVFAIFLICLVLIAVIDYIELARRTFDREGFDAWQAALVTLFRVPTISEAVLPFATLFGAMAAFIVANRRLELVVVRAAGVSAWQFLLPGAVVGLMIGVAAVTLYNPLAAALKERSLAIAAGMEGSGGSSLSETSGPVWLRQEGPDGESIIGAAESRDRGLTLADVTVYLFAPDGSFRERVDAAEGTLIGEEWHLAPATVIRPGASPREVESYRLRTSLSETEISEALADVETLSFWQLPRLISIAESAGLPADRFRLHFHTLLARPFLLLAMVLIAGAVTLRFSRLIGLGSMIWTGVVAGFVLYVVNEITRDLGSGGLLPPAMAAWLPAILSIMLSTTVLLVREDG